METGVSNKKLYIAMSAVDGKAIVHGVATDRTGLDECQIFFVLDPANLGDQIASAEMIDWLTDRDVLGADLTAAKSDLVDAIRKFLRDRNGASGGRAGLYEPPIVVACPCCGETANLELNDCMKPGGKGCCPWVLCGVCRYSGPESRGAREAIEAWNAGEINPQLLMRARIKRNNMNIDAITVCRSIGMALEHNSTVDMDDVMEFCNRHPAMRDDVVNFMRAIGQQAARMAERLRG